MSESQRLLSRRFLLRASTYAAAIGLSGGASVLTALAQAPLAPTPSCDDGDDPTPQQTAGPFFKPRSPQRTSLVEPGMAGNRITLTGRVLSRNCRSVPNVLVDLWQADSRGQYDNAGFRLRGHQFTDAQGRYRFETIVPGRYPGRTPHFHLRVQAKRRAILTTQLYFPGERGNARDGLFDPALVMQVGGGQARYDLVLAMG